MSLQGAYFLELEFMLQDRMIRRCVNRPSDKLTVAMIISFGLEFKMLAEPDDPTQWWIMCRGNGSDNDISKVFKL